MHEFTWLSLISDKIHHENIHVFSSALVVIFIVIVSYIVHRRLRDVESHLVPAGKWTLTNVFEAAVENLLALMEKVVGKEAERYFPLIGALFIYIFLCNLLGLIPGFLPPTDKISTNFACALTVFFYYHAVGMKRHGVKKYLQHFIDPVRHVRPFFMLFFLVPVFLFTELVSHLVRPVSLSVRLFGNITGDHLVLGIFSDLLPVVVPIAFLALGLFVSFIQAFVFSLLSTVYIALATEVQEGHEHKEGGEG